jgi:hypothetical protein
MKVSTKRRRLDASAAGSASASLSWARCSAIDPEVFTAPGSPTRRRKCGSSSWLDPNVGPGNASAGRSRMALSMSAEVLTPTTASAWAIESK